MSGNSFVELRHEFFKSRCISASEVLGKKGFDARVFSRASESVDAILEIIEKGASIGAGGSVTLQETGVFERLSERGDHVVRHSPEMDAAVSLKARKDAGRCRYYLSSSNAITMEGELVNVDGIGNRVAAMAFGPETVIVLAGANKLVANREEAISRIKNIAAPANARRLGLDTPCVKAGRCVNCKSPMNICRITTIISMKPVWTDFKIFLVAEESGL